MAQDMFEKGKALRSQVVGEARVKELLDNADDFNRPFQEFVTENCWGFVWGDDALDLKTRSMLNLTMIAALNRMTEWELHLRGALKNGVTKEELRSVLHQIAAYCGAPAGVECFRIANRVLAEEE